MAESNSNEIREKLKKQAVRDQLWRRGVITSWYLDDYQKKFIHFIKNNEDQVSVVLSSRQSGKSTTLFSYVAEECLKNPGFKAIMLYPTRDSAKRISKEKFNSIFESCPSDMKPEFKERDFLYVFKNGSTIQIAGSDNGSYEKLRGLSGGNLCVVDEAGFIKDLKYIIRSVIGPIVSTVNGKIVLSSTPPKEKSHDFNHYIKDAQYKNKLHIVTVYDNPRIDQKTLDAIIRECGGVDSPDFRREYLCEVVYDDGSLIVPEFTVDVEDKATREYSRPAIFESYVAMDVGFNDATAVLFAYYDFKQAAVVVEDELFLKGKTTDIIAEGILEKEAELWTDDLGEQTEPVKRVSDTNLLLIADLERLHGLTFETTKKDNKDAAINEMRLMIREGRVIINPKCTNLLFELRNGEWTANGKDFRRLPNGSHCDTLMALVYLLRSIDYSSNPYPVQKSYYDQNKWSKPKDNSFSHSDNPFKAALARQFKGIKR